MPKLSTSVTLEITLAQFIRNCSTVELQELQLLIDSDLKRRQGAQQRAKMIVDFNRETTEFDVTQFPTLEDVKNYLKEKGISMTSVEGTQILDEYMEKVVFAKD